MAHPQTEETKRKISKANKGRKRTPEAIEKQRQSRLKGFKEGRIKIPWKGKKSPTIQKKGEDSPYWKGGRSVDKNGYVWLRIPEHPNANSGGLVAEHRKVMAETIGRPLWPWENVHHRNGIRGDNRPENLQLVMVGGHSGEVKCPHCNKSFNIK